MDAPEGLVFFVVAVVVAVVVVVVIFVVLSKHAAAEAAREALQARSLTETISYLDFEQLKLLAIYPPPAKNMQKLYLDYVAQREQQAQECQEALRLAREVEFIQDLPKLDIITSAQIAQATIKSFDPKKILDVSDFLSGSDIQEAVESLHETLRPIYEETLIAHYQNNLGIADVKAEYIQPQIERCMEQGFSAILKFEELQSFLDEGSQQSSGKLIKKKRTWKEISGEGS